MRNRVFFIMLAVFGAVLFPAAGFGQSLQEMSPYDVTLALAVAPGADAALLADDLQRDLAQQIASQIGGAWNVKFFEPPTALAADMLKNLDAMAYQKLPEALRKEGDKVYFLVVSAADGGYIVAARELDVPLQTLSPVMTAEVPAAGKLGSGVFSIMLQTFSAVATIDQLEGERAVLRVRASRIPTPEPDILMLKPGMVGLPVVRINNNRGVAQKISPVAWTYFVVEGVHNQLVDGFLETGIRSPLTGRRRGRREEVILAVNPTLRSTTLRLTSRDEKDKPLAGYAVYTLGTTSVGGASSQAAAAMAVLQEQQKPADSLDKKSGKRLNLVGRTDWKGEIVIPPQVESPLAVVIIKSGTSILAKLPLVPGQEPLMTVEVPDQDALMAAEGAIVGLQEELVDMVASRQLLIARAMARLDDGDLEAAEALREEIRNLPLASDFEMKIRDQHTLYSASNDKVQKQIDQMFTHAYVLLTKFYPPTATDELERSLQAAKKSAKSAKKPAKKPAKKKVAVEEDDE